MAAVLGVPEVRFAASLTSGGGGCAGALGLAAAAIHGGMANVCVTVMTLQQLNRRLGGSEVDGVLAYATMSEGGGAYGGGGACRRAVAFTANAGLLSPGHSFSVLAQRHMHLYGTTREHFAEVAISQRENAIRRPDDRAADAAAHARRVLRRADDLRPAVPVRLHAWRATARWR